MKKYDYLLFDADNTLFDFHASEAFALEQVLTDLGIAFIQGHMDTYRVINHEVWRNFENGKLEKSKLRGRRFELFFRELNIRADIDRVATEYLEHLSHTAFMIPGAEALLEEVSKNHKLVLVTNGLKEVQRPRLSRSTIEHHFEAVVVSDEIGYAKPDAAFFDYVFNTIQYPDKSRVLMIGDNINADIRGGLEYGLDSCWYNPDRKTKENGILPTYEIENISHLRDILI
jgi:YjjG family noncanonical pyrimidine nucleotidase